MMFSVLPTLDIFCNRIFGKIFLVSHFRKINFDTYVWSSFRHGVGITENLLSMKLGGAFKTKYFND